jgi:hypothetical protein
MRYRNLSYGRTSAGVALFPAQKLRLYSLPTVALLLLVFVSFLTISVLHSSLLRRFETSLQKNSISFLPSQGSYAPPTSVRGKNTDSLSILMTAVTNTRRPVWDDEIVQSVESERCDRYGWTYDKSRTKRRRIFAGSLIADDSWDAIGIGAIEAYGIYSALALVESNRTQMFYERKLRFGPDSRNIRMLQSGIYGPDTKVTVDYHVDENSERISLIRENMAREMILQRWKQSGMKSDDIGLIMDIDEMFSRDFLRAVQLCDVPEFRPEEQNCRAPKLLSRALVFEVGPECIKGNHQYWGHPDMIIGKCVDQIGDAEKHRPPDRVYMNVHGWRKEGYYDINGTGSYPMMPDTTHFPLWNAADFRMTPGGKQPGSGHTGFHFHNFFPNFDRIRVKYETYGHPIQGARTMALSDLHSDIDLFVKCAMDRPDGDRLPGGLKHVEGPIPLALNLKSYTRARHEEMRKALVADEAKYGCSGCSA